MRFIRYVFSLSILATIYFISFDLKSNATIFIDDGLEYSRSVENGGFPAEGNGEFSEKMWLRARDSALRAQMGKRAREKAVVFYDLQQLGSELVGIIEGLGYINA